MYAFMSCNIGNETADHTKDVIELDIRKAMVQKEKDHYVSDLTERINHTFITTQNGIGGTERYLNNILYDKKATVLTKTGDFINDIDGGMSFWPKFSAGNTLITHFQAYEFIDHYRSTVGTIDHGESFINLVNNLEEGDNPVLVLVQ